MLSTSSLLSKNEIQELVSSDDPSIAFMKPENTRSECWKNFSQIFHTKVAQDFVICLECKTILKWTSANGTRVMTHHNCLKNKNTPTHSPRQRTISSYCQSTSLSSEYPIFQKRITDACVEFCAIDGRPFESVAGAGFLNLAKQLVSVGACLGTSVCAAKLLPHPSTVSIGFTLNCKMTFDKKIHFSQISRHVERMYIDLKTQLVSLCKSLRFFSLTTDFWTEKFTGNQI